MQREVYEETNLKVKPLKKIGNFQTKYNNVKIHYTLFEGEIVSGEIQLSKDHKEYKWLTKEEIKTLQVTPIITWYLESN